MDVAETAILTVNGGSSSIKFALFTVGRWLTRVLSGAIEPIGQADATLRVSATPSAPSFARKVAAPDRKAAVRVLMTWVQERCGRDLSAVGHRVVHGGGLGAEPRRITKALREALLQLAPIDPEHLPEELRLIEAFEERFPELPQIACFDTTFHHDLPRVARLLPIPRRYEAQGVRRYGFHGLSCAFLMQELLRLEGPRMARGRVVLAHLGGGASVTAVYDGKSVDTSMSFTPLSGLPMSTRAGDLDPGLVCYLMRQERLDAAQLQNVLSAQSGLLGMSESSSDMRTLLARERADARAAEAVAVFCYQTKKWIGAFAAALGGLDALVFAGGIGENAPEVRARICAGLGFLGIELDAARNHLGEGAISSASSRVSVRVLKTDEERMIAEAVCGVLSMPHAGFRDALRTGGST